MNYGSLMGYLGYRSNAMASIYMSPTLTSTGRLNSGSWQKVWEHFRLRSRSHRRQVDRHGGHGLVRRLSLLRHDAGAWHRRRGAPRSLPDLHRPTRQHVRASGIVPRQGLHRRQSRRAAPLRRQPTPQVHAAGGRRHASRASGRSPTTTRAPPCRPRRHRQRRQHYIWSMAVAHNRLYVGTFDASTVAGWATTTSPTTATRWPWRTRPQRRPGTWMGADLWRVLPRYAGGQPVQAFPGEQDRRGQSAEPRHPQHERR